MRTSPTARWRWWAAAKRAARAVRSHRRAPARWTTTIGAAVTGSTSVLEMVKKIFFVKILTKKIIFCEKQSFFSKIWGQNLGERIPSRRITKIPKILIPNFTRSRKFWSRLSHKSRKSKNVRSRLSRNPPIPKISISKNDAQIVGIETNIPIPILKSSLSRKSRKSQKFWSQSRMSWNLDTENFNAENIIPNGSGSGLGWNLVPYRLHQHRFKIFGVR